MLAALLCLSASAQTITGRVVAIADGDTLTVLDAAKRQHKIRLSGIDAPESNQDFGSRSKQSLSDLVFDKTVTILSSGKEHRGRALGKVTLNGRDINLEQVHRGQAWFYKQYAHELSRDDATAYEQAEARAKRERRGLWGNPAPVPPWDFRRGVRTATTSGAKPSTPTGGIIGNRNSKIYHRQNCPGYNRVSTGNRVSFKSEAEAEAAGYTKARNCSQ